MKNFPKDPNWSVMVTTVNNGVLASLCDPLSNVVRIDVIHEDDLSNRYSANSLLSTVLNQFQFATEQEDQEEQEPIEPQAPAPEPAALAEEEDDNPF